MNGPITEVYWYKNRPQTLPALAEHTSADAVIVGGGLAGLSAAQLFAEQGKSVVLLERNFCGGGATGKSSGFISQDSELELSDLIENLGIDCAKKLWGFVGDAMEVMRTNITTHNISCDYLPQDYVFLATKAKALRRVRREHESRVELGLTSTLYEKDKLGELIGSRDHVGGVRYGGTFGINPFQYAQGLKEHLLKSGVRIYEDTPVTRVIRDGVETTSHTVTAKHVIIAVDRFLPDLLEKERNTYHVQTFLSITKPLTPSDMQLIFPSGHLMVADSDLIYQYFRPTGENRLLLGGGTFLDTYRASTPSSLKRIERKLTHYLRRQFPQAVLEPEFMWPGFLGVSKDLVPLAGRIPSHPSAFFVSGATGLAWATGLGRYVVEKVLHGSDDYDAYFNPARRFPGDPLANTFQNLFSTAVTFAASHGFVKYFK